MEGKIKVIKQYLQLNRSAEVTSVFVLKQYYSKPGPRGKKMSNKNAEIAPTLSTSLTKSLYCKCGASLSG